MFPGNNMIRRTPKSTSFKKFFLKENGDFNLIGGFFIMIIVSIIWMVLLGALLFTVDLILPSSGNSIEGNCRVLPHGVEIGCD